MNNIRTQANEIKGRHQLESSLVGVKFLWKTDNMPDAARVLSNHLYCQALKEDRQDEHVFLDAEIFAEKIEFLSKKAIPNSRAKNALAMLKRKEAEKISQADPFFEN